MHYEFVAYDGLSDFIVCADTVEDAAHMSVHNPARWREDYKVICLESGDVVNPVEVR